MRGKLILAIGLMGCQTPVPASVQKAPPPSPRPEAAVARPLPAPPTQRAVPVSQPVPMLQPMMPEPQALEPPKNYIIHERTTIVMDTPPGQSALPRTGMPLEGTKPQLPPTTGPTVQEELPPRAEASLPAPSLGMPMQQQPQMPSMSAPMMPGTGQVMLWRQRMEEAIISGPPQSPGG